MQLTKKDIIALPNAQLRRSSKEVDVVNNRVKVLAKGMVKATLDWEDSRSHEVGVALAAVQVDKLLRVVIIRKNLEDKTNREFDVFINPEITKYEGEIIEDYEGCLSIKDIYGKVPRYEKVRIKALNLDGKVVRLKAEGFLARVFQHEVDHTNGKVFIDHIKGNTEAFFRLDKEGKLHPIDYDKEIKNNTKLWS